MAILIDEFRGRISTARALPSPPVVTARLIELCEDPATGIKEIIDLVGTDPSLTARLLRLANSPIYARRRRTENLRQAVMLLGVDAVLTASLSLTLLAGSSATSPVSKAFRQRCWTRSVHAAASAQILAERVTGVKPSDAFLASLLQDIGVQVVIRLEPTAYDLLDAESSHEALIATEIERVGADHASIGGELLAMWKLPARIVAAVQASHTPGGAEATQLSNLVAISAMVADGVAGRDDAVRNATDAALALLGIDDVTFASALDDLAIVLPDLALILDAEAPDPETLAEMAGEVIVARNINAQAITAVLLERVATLTAVAEELRVETRLDPLTGLSNRRELDDVMDREFALANDHGFPLSLLFIDLDDFKKVNDRFGHTVGDELLIQTARRVSACVRDGDLVGRFGGEEFIVVLPGADRAGSEVVAQRLIERFDDRSFEIGAEVWVRQTVSVGVATFDAHHEFSNTAELLHAADGALYAAKHGGKNQWQRSLTDTPFLLHTASNATSLERRPVADSPATSSSESSQPSVSPNRPANARSG